MYLQTQIKIQKQMDNAFYVYIKTKKETPIPLVKVFNGTLKHD